MAPDSGQSCSSGFVHNRQQVQISCSAKSCVPCSSLPSGCSLSSTGADLHEHHIGGVIARASCRGVDGEAQVGGLVDSDGPAAGADCQPSRGTQCVDDLGCVAGLQAKR